MVHCLSMLFITAQISSVFFYSFWSCSLVWWVNPQPTRYRIMVTWLMPLSVIMSVLKVSRQQSQTSNLVSLTNQRPALYQVWPIIDQYSIKPDMHRFGNRAPLATVSRRFGTLGDDFRNTYPAQSIEYPHELYKEISGDTIPPPILRQ